MSEGFWGREVTCEVMAEVPYRQSGSLVSALRGIVRSLRLQVYKAKSRGRLTWGKNCWIGPSARITSPNYCRLGNNVGTGADMIVEADLEVGDDVLISSRVAFISDDHKFEDPNTTVFWNGRREDCAITLGGDNLIGHGVIVIGPVKIGKGCIVGSGAVVTRDLPDYTVCVGMPAKPIRKRFPDSPGSTD